MPLSRRTALILLGSGAGAGVLAGCTAGRNRPFPGPLPSPNTPRPTTTSAEGRLEQAIPGSLRDRVGVNVHWSYYDTPYGNYDDVKQLLVASGIRHVRGELLKAADLHTRGINTTLLIDLDYPNGQGDPFDLIRQAEPSIRSGAVAAVEGPNEPDLFWEGRNYTYKGQSFPDAALTFQKDLYRAVKSNRYLRRMPVFGMSMGKTYWGGGFPYANGALASSADFGNFHPYPGGNPFANRYPYAGINDYFANSDFPSATLDQYPINFTSYEPAYNSKRMVASETGYSTWYLGQSEVVQGWYTPRIFLENARLGIRRTYLYEFLDVFADPNLTNRDAHFGLLRNDLSKKPAYTAVQSLLAALGDGVPSPRTTASVNGLTYEVAVDPPTGYDARALHYLTFAMPDGSTSMALWHEVSADDLNPVRRTPQTPITRVNHPPMQVEVSVTSRTRPATQLPTAFRLGDDGQWAPLSIDRTPTSATMNVDGRVVLLRL